MTDTQHHPDSPAHLEPPPAPRAATPMVRRRAWSEPTVRFWWVAGIILLLAAAYFAATRWMAWREDKRLVEMPTYPAKIVWAGGEAIPGRPKKPTSDFKLELTVNGKPVKLAGTLVGIAEDKAVDEIVPIHLDVATVDNAAPRWTARSQAPPLLHAMFAAALLLGAAVLTAIVGVVRRMAVLRTWRDGEPAVATVVHLRQTPLAPRSRIARCTIAGQPSNAELVAVYVPPRFGDLNKGDELWVIHPPAKPTKALAVAWFESRT